MYIRQHNEDDLRVKIVKVSMEKIMQFMYMQTQTPGCVEVCKSDLPKDFRVVSVDKDWLPERLSVLIHHSSFPIVPPGENPPVIGYDWWTELIALATKEEMNERQRKILEQWSKATLQGTLESTSDI